MLKLESVRAAVLDTHIWIWLSGGDPKGAAFTVFRGQPIVSAISLWEVSMLATKGRLTLRPDPQSWIETNLADPIQLEPLTPAICVDSCQLQDFHGDPADRLIVATALNLGVPLLTVDRSIVEWAASHPELHVLTAP